MIKEIAKKKYFDRKNAKDLMNYCINMFQMKEQKNYFSV